MFAFGLNFIYFCIIIFGLYILLSDIKKYKLDFMFRCLFLFKNIYYNIKFTLTGFFIIFTNPYHLYILLRKFNDFNNGDEQI